MWSQSVSATESSGRDGDWKDKNKKHTNKESAVQ